MKRSSSNRSSPGQQKRTHKKLHGLAQAVYIMKCLARRKNKEKIVAKFKGDEELVDVWIGFLLHNHWIESRSGGCVPTYKGKMWAGRFEPDQATKRKARTTADAIT